MAGRAVRLRATPDQFSWKLIAGLRAVDYTHIRGVLNLLWPCRRVARRSQPSVPGTFSALFPDDLLNFFLDDNVVEGEYSNGRVALVRVYEGVLDGTTVAQLANDPFAPAVPEPASVVLLGVGALGLLGYGWRGVRKKAPTVE